jgi:multiple sugar transport system permease protein
MLKAVALKVGKYIALLALLVFAGFPVLLIILGSFKANRDVFAFPPSFVFQPTLENYETLVRAWPTFFEALRNSLIIASCATVLTVVACCLAGYAYSRYRGRALAASAFFMIFIRMLPPLVITVPLFPVVNRLHLNDTHLILILLYTAFYVSLGSFIMKTFIDQIPRELDEAAVADGAGVMQIIRMVIVPLAGPGLVAVGIFTFIFAWNEFIFAFIFASTEARTGPLIISEMLGALDGVEWGVLFAAVSLQLLPILLIVTFAQRFIVAGLTAGSVKG